MRLHRPAAERGHADHGWLRTWHSFSFADYHDPAWQGFHNLRVLNEDVVAPGTGFGMHPHRDMEIVTWILAGALRHRDSLGHEAVIRPGEAQRMSAGSGILHSETNPSATEPVHLLQIWLLPSRRGGTPGYEQRPLPAAADGWRLLAAPPAGGGAVTIQSEARIWVVEPAQGALPARPWSGRPTWVHVSAGAVQVNGEILQAGDGLGLAGEDSLLLTGETRKNQLLVFELA
ncbi:MAG: pirin family protein [Candidatus Delongbacteria bacterium]